MLRASSVGFVVMLLTGLAGAVALGAHGAEAEQDKGGTGIEPALTGGLASELTSDLASELATGVTRDHVQEPRVTQGSGPLIVIDPGHGGTNTGAPGVEQGFFEKRLTLALAQRLEKDLEDQGYRVALTRSHDVYLTLRQRIKQANQLGADLFISLHANATETHAQRGYETFILTPQALDVDSRALRMADGAPRPGLDAETAFLLDDLERGMVQPTAADLASAIQAELRQVRGPIGDRGVRQDAMHVLLGATMPAVLVEVGFVDHAIEGRELLDPGVQTQISEAMTRAVVATLPPR